MIIEYSPEKINLKHPFRYINGVVIRSGVNQVNSQDYSLLENNDTFIQLLNDGAIVVSQEKSKKKANPKPPVEVPPVEAHPEVATQTVDYDSLGKMPYRDAIALVEITDDKELLIKYQEEENSVGQRAKVLKAIEDKINQLGV